MTRRFLVRGRVQGVGYRQFVRRQALELELAGHAVNLASGDVEVVAQGEAAALEELERRLRQGPPLAHVASVAVEPAPDEPRQGFTTG